MSSFRSPKHPSLYEIHTRVWLRRFDLSDKKATLRDVPQEYWDHLKSMGIDLVWLMGVWQTNEQEFDRSRLNDFLTEKYKQYLPDFQPEDDIGSPYAIDDYVFNPEIGSEKDFLSLRKLLHQKGLKLILDFVPNHLGRHTRYLNSHPEYFIQCSEFEYLQFPNFYFRNEENPEKIYAHGRDPYHGEWIDTVQLDYSKRSTRDFMVRQLERIASFCDGVRCDMAMMLLKDIFRDSWSSVLSAQVMAGWKEEFWTEAIGTIKSAYPDFLFIAEVYWGKERKLLSLGFDFCYDKVLLDKIKSRNAPVVKEYLRQLMPLHSRTAHFLENHDESRIQSQFLPSESWCAAGLISVLPGMRFFYDGQWEGKRYHASVHLGRSHHESPCPCPTRQDLLDSAFFQNSFENSELFGIPHVQTSGEKRIQRYPIEPVCICTYNFHRRLLNIFQAEIFREGECIYFSPLVLDNSGNTIENVLSFTWQLGSVSCLVFLNFSGHYYNCQIHLPFAFQQADRIVDLMNDLTIEKSQNIEEIDIAQFDMIPWGIRVLQKNS